MMKKEITFTEIISRIAPTGNLLFSQLNAFDTIFYGGKSNVAALAANNDRQYCRLSSV
jgi:hypothetical protein